MQQVLGCSVSYRIAIGPQQGHKVFTLQTLPSWEEEDRFVLVAKESGFSLHAGVAAQRWERKTGAALPLHHQTGGIRETPINDFLGEYPLQA
jgi:hypothetical protein